MNACSVIDDCLQVFGILFVMFMNVMLILMLVLMLLVLMMQLMLLLIVVVVDADVAVDVVVPVDVVNVIFVYECLQVFTTSSLILPRLVPRLYYVSGCDWHTICDVYVDAVNVAVDDGDIIFMLCLQFIFIIGDESALSFILFSLIYKHD